MSGLMIQVMCVGGRPLARLVGAPLRCHSPCEVGLGQRDVPHLAEERSEGGSRVAEQSKQATENARQTGEIKKQVVPPDLLEEVFELNMQLEEMRANLKMGEDDPALRGDLERAQAQFKGMLASVDEDLQRSWAAWDVSLDANDSAGKSKQKDAMVALLDRRSYLRNLLREVDSVLTPQVAGTTKVNI